MFVASKSASTDQKLLPASIVSFIAHDPHAQALLTIRSSATDKLSLDSFRNTPVFQGRGI